MGWANLSAKDQKAREREYREMLQQREKEKDTKRMILSEKIALMVSKKIEDELIRPGPVEEERECYDVAKELRDMAPGISELIAKILKAEGITP